MLMECGILLIGNTVEMAGGDINTDLVIFHINTQEIGFHYTKEAYLKNTYKLEDIFHNRTITTLKNQTEYKVDQLYTRNFGMCYTIQKLAPVAIFEFSVNFGLNTNWDVQIFVHNLGMYLSKHTFQFML